MYYDKKIAVVIPAYNEQQSIGKVVHDFLMLLDPATHRMLVDQLVVCNNRSSDGTAAVAKAAGAHVVYEQRQGYGSACLKALQALKNPDIVVFVDGDNSAVSSEVFYLLEQFSKGADLVIGSRSLGQQHSGALTLPQKVGNLMACRLIAWLWRQRVTDLGPFRAICYQSLRKLDMQDPAFGWTVEMQVKAMQHDMAISEVPVSTRKRLGKSKISGTIRGVIGAASGIFGMIYTLWRQQLLLKKARYYD